MIRQHEPLAVFRRIAFDMSCGHHVGVRCSIAFRALTGDKYEPRERTDVGVTRGSLATWLFAEVPRRFCDRVGSLVLVAVCHECETVATVHTSVIPAQMPGHDLYFTTEPEEQCDCDGPFSRSHNRRRGCPVHGAPE